MIVRYYISRFKKSFWSSTKMGFPTIPIIQSLFPAIWTTAMILWNPSLRLGCRRSKSNRGISQNICLSLLWNKFLREAPFCKRKGAKEKGFKKTNSPNSIRKTRLKSTSTDTRAWPLSLAKGVLKIDHKKKWTNQLICTTRLYFQSSCPEIRHNPGTTSNRSTNS